MERIAVAHIAMETHKSGEHARVVLCRIEYDLLLVKPHVVQTKTTNFQTKNTLLTQQKPSPNGR